MKTTVDCSECQPKSWYETCNTIKMTPDAPYNGKYSNNNVIIWCDCPCHINNHIMHMYPCCEYTYKSVK